MQVLFQSEYSECGLASVAMLASAHGLMIDLNTLRARYPISLKGSTLLDLVNMASELGMSTRAVRCEVNDIPNLKLPAVLHWDLNHFVVLAKKRGNKFIVHDPAQGKRIVTEKDFNRSFTGVALEAWPGPEFSKQDLKSRLKISSVIPKDRYVIRTIGALFVFAFAIETSILVLPILQQVLIDNALVTADTSLLGILVLAAGIFLVGQATTVAIRSLIQRNLSSSLSMIVPGHVFQHLASLPVDWFEKRSTADVINRFESGNTIHQTLTTNIVIAGIDGLVAIVALGAMFFYNIQLGLIVFIASVGYALIRIAWYNSYRLKSQQELIEKSNVVAFLWETVQGIATIKLFNGLANRQTRFLAKASRHVAVKAEILTADAMFGFLYDMIVAVERVAILYFGGLAVLDGSFTVGMLVAFLSFRENFVLKSKSLINAGIEFKILGVHLDRLSDILTTEKEYKTSLPFIGSTSSSGRLEVRNASYRYGKNEVDVLRNCNLSISDGETIAIVGPSGSGKSTLLKVISGEVQPQTGDVYVDGMAVSSMGLNRLRQIISVVRQDDMLFNGTILENIAFLDDHPDHDRVIEVAKSARIFDEIQAMPMGFNTLIGAMGTGLSGGQLQRLMLARALYRKARILILDEATSSLDLENERNISRELKKLKITQIIVAHRPETIKKADRVINITEISG